MTLIVCVLLLVLVQTACFRRKAGKVSVLARSQSFGGGFARKWSRSERKHPDTR